MTAATSTATALLDAALDYAAHGWGVFPCKGKIPRTPNGCKDATTDRYQIGDWWRTWPNANIGIATGAASGLVVLDIDKDKGGYQSLDYLETDHGELLANVIVCTGGGGLHYYFQHPGGTVKNRTGLWPGIDIRGDGGYVVAPPSDHASGGVYRWDELRAPGEIALAEIPASLLAALRSEPQRAERNGAPATGRGLLLQRAQQYVANISGVGEGQRNATVFNVAGNVAAFVDEKGGRLSEGDILDVVRPLNQRFSPPLEDSELEKCVASALQNGSPRAAKVVTPKHEKNGRSATKEKAPLTVERVRVADVEPQDVEWLWPGRIALGKVTLIAGDPGLGKSFLTLDIAARVTRGWSWPDAMGVTQTAGDVLLLSAEDDIADTIRPRLDAMGADCTRVTALSFVRGSDDDGDYRRAIDLGRDVERLREVIEANFSVRLLIVDPVSAYLGNTDSHKNAEVRAVLAPLAELAAEKRIAILCVTHLRKGEGAAMYRAMGSLAFVAAARGVWAVVRDQTDPHRRLLLTIKNNLAADSANGLAFAIEPHGPGGVPVVCWEAEPVTITTEEAMAPEPRRRGRPPEERDEAADWLRGALANGPRLAADVLEDGVQGEGLSRRTIDRARKVVGVKAYRPEHLGAWWWKLPE